MFPHRIHKQVSIYKGFKTQDYISKQKCNFSPHTFMQTTSLTTDIKSFFAYPKCSYKYDEMHRLENMANIFFML